MPFCIECGHAMQSDVAVCPSCQGEPPQPPDPPAPPQPPDPPQAPDLPAPRHSDRRGRLRMLAAAATAVLGVFLGGTASGWYLADRFSPRSAGNIVVPSGDHDTVAADTTGAGEHDTMPDVRGLTEADAKQVFADVGLAGVTVSVGSQPWIGTPGTVVAQDPAGGAPAKSQVRLTLAAPAIVPSLVGSDVNKAVQAVQALGAQAKVHRVYQPNATVDQVLAVEPAAGTPLGQTVVITAASPPSTVYLSELKPITGGCAISDQGSVNGQASTHLVVCRAGVSGASTAYLLGRRALRLEATVGQPDDATPGGTLTVQIIGDGRTLDSATLAYGQSKKISLNTTGVLRLELRAAMTGAAADGSSCCISAAFADALVLTSASDAAALRTAGP